MPKVSNIIKISKDNYNTLQGGGSVWKDGMQHTYDNNAVYLVEGGYTGVQGIQGLRGLNGGQDYVVGGMTVNGSGIQLDFGSYTYYNVTIPSDNANTLFSLAWTQRDATNLFGYAFIVNKKSVDITIRVGGDEDNNTFSPTNTILVESGKGVEVSTIFLSDGANNISVVSTSPLMSQIS